MEDVARHPLVARQYPVIAQSLNLAASAPLRNMATVGGNVLQRTRCTYFRDTSWKACNKRNPARVARRSKDFNRPHAVLGVSPHCIAAYPGDFAQALIALDATVEVRSVRERRTISFAELHRPPGERPDIETSLAPDELIAAFFIPAANWTRRSRFVKVRDRESYEFALASAAVALDMGQDGVVNNAFKIALGRKTRSNAPSPRLRRSRSDMATSSPAQQMNMGKPIPRFDARLKVTGAARYPSDEPLANRAFACLAISSIARGAIRDMNLDSCQTMGR